MRRWRPSLAAVWTAVASLLVTAALTITALALYNHNENRLLRVRVRELGLVFSSATGAVAPPLASASALADATGGNAARFDALMTPYVGPHGQFASASLWRVGDPAPLAEVGPPTALAAHVGAFVAGAVHVDGLEVTSLLAAARPHIEYAYHTPGSTSGLVVVAESIPLRSRHSKLQSNKAFDGINYVVYFGRTQTPSQLLVTNLSKLPASGRRASEVVPFGNSSLTLVITPVGSLGGTVFESLPWIIAVVGLALSALAALMTDRLANRQRRAEELALELDHVAEENRRLYTEQRSIARELQQALLPDIATLTGELEASARYVAGIAGIDVGGDWYDLVPVDADHVMLVVGDVSGRGIQAATTMAFLRNSIIAYAAQADSPGTVLSKLARLVDSRPHDFFATVLCALVDVTDHTMTLVTAGHLPPLLLEDGVARFIDVPVAAPVGATRDFHYEETTVTVAKNATVIAFTDGLVERRGESLDVGLERLRAAAVGGDVPLEQLVTRILALLEHEQGHDDTAILAVRWRH